MREVDAGALLEQFHGQVVLAAVSGGAVEHRRIGSLGVRDEFRHGFCRDRWTHHQFKGLFGNGRHTHQIGERVEAHFGIDMRIDRDLGVGAQKQGVSIGTRSGHQFAGDVAVRSRTVFNHHRLPHVVSDLGGKQARNDVGPCGRRAVGNDLDGFLRVLRMRHSMKHCAGCNDCEQG